MADFELRQRFYDRYPVFDGNSDFDVDRVDYFLERLQMHFDEEIWDEYYEEGLFHLTAHNLIVEFAQTTDPGNLQKLNPVTVKMIGKISTSFGAHLTTVADAGAATFNTTSYGREYYNLRSEISTGGYVP